MQGAIESGNATEVGRLAAAAEGPRKKRRTDPNNSASDVEFESNLKYICSQCHDLSENEGRCILEHQPITLPIGSVIRDSCNGSEGIQGELRENDRGDAGSETNTSVSTSNFIRKIRG